MPRRPPGPSLRLWSTWQVIARPLTAMPGWLAQYGDPVLLPMINGDVVLTAQPTLIKKIFATAAPSYGPFAADGIAALTGPRSLFQLRDREHRRHRQLIMPSFHGSRMRTYATEIQEATRRVFDGAIGRGSVRLHELTQRISLDVILRTVFGVQGPERVERFYTAITQLVDATSPLFMFMPFLQREFGGIGPFARFRRTFVNTNDLLQEQIVRARREPGGRDILSMLLATRDEDGRGLDDEEIRDELRTLLFAGHETTGIALSWAVDAIGRNAAVAQRLTQELETLSPEPEPENLAKLEYLDAVCNETLRLHPIVTEVLRTLHQSLELGGYDLRPPTAVAASILGVHRNPSLYPQPEVFRPERFLERKFGPHEFLPFGGGHRRCVGAAFAGFEMRVVLGTILREYAVKQLSPCTPRAVRRNVVMAPEGGIPVVITRAQPGSVSAAVA